MLTTIGLSPRVTRPLLLSLIGAVALYLLGMHDEARAVAGAAILGAIAAQSAPPGLTIARGAEDDPSLAELDLDEEADPLDAQEDWT